MKQLLLLQAALSFYYNSPKDSGLPGGGKDVSSQTERGLGYRNYVEQAAALGYVVFESGQPEPVQPIRPTNA